MRPNILLICTDQQRYDSLGCYGNAHAQTPHIDGLARGGVRFERCYVQSPVCGPSRATLFTGKYPPAHGLWANGVALPPGRTHVTRLLADAGYDCGMTGKNHLAASFGGRTEARQDDGFRLYEWAHDPSQGSPENAYHRWLSGAHPDLYATAMAAGTGRTRHTEGLWDTMPTEAHYSHWIGETATGFLRENRAGGEPWFLLANFFDPHHPFVAPEEYLARFDAETLPPPLGGPDDLQNRPPILAEASRATYAGHAKGFAEYTPAELRETVRAYYAMVALIDDEVGRILAALDASGQRDDTLVIFTSDHGEMLGDHGLMLKGPMFYEGAVRVPLILRWPGRLPTGETRGDLVQWLDLAPTLMDAAGLPPFPGHQGASLLPLARADADAAALWRDWAICTYRNSGHPYDVPVLASMLRHGPHKLVVHHGPPASARERGGELYDLDADPHEMTNLWADPAHRETRYALQEMLTDALVAAEDRTQPREAYW